MDCLALELEGAFYSALAEFVMSNPHLAELIDKENIIAIAKCWRPDMKMTEAHIRGEAPELTDGVVLRPFESDEDEPNLGDAIVQRENGDEVAQESEPAETAE